MRTTVLMKATVQFCVFETEWEDGTERKQLMRLSHVKVKSLDREQWERENPIKNLNINQGGKLMVGLDEL